MRSALCNHLHHVAIEVFERRLEPEKRSAERYGHLNGQSSPAALECGVPYSFQLENHITRDLPKCAFTNGSSVLVGMDGWRQERAITCPGFCSDSYLKMISSPSGIPFSMVAVSVFSSL